MSDNSAIALWQEKLNSLQAAEALVVDPAAKFKLGKDINEAKSRLQELRDEAAATSTVDALGLPSPALRTDVDRSDQFSGGDVAKTIAYLVMTALGALLSWLIAARSAALGSALTALLSILGGISFLAISLIYGRYFAILESGGEPDESPERQSYVRLRASLARGGLAARLYAYRLTKFLRAVDRFFGDARMADRSLFPHAFGLKVERPLWTPRAFDRCLFLALVYPIATIFFIWAVAGYAGPAEMALGLKPDVPGLTRGFVATAAIFVGFILWSFFRSKKRNSIDSPIGDRANPRAIAIVAALIALGTVAGAAGLTFAFDSVGAGAVAFGVAVVGAVASTNRVAGAVTVATGVPIAIGLAFGLDGSPQSTIAVVIATAAASALGVLLLCWIAIRLEVQGVFLFFFIPTAILVCFYAVGHLLPLKTTWPYTGPLLLFEGLLTLINAPFNWASIGLARALLWRGLELKGWWPYFLALMNVLLATAIVALLALAMVIATQAYNEVVAHGGRDQILPLDRLFEGISKDPAASDYWWIYALLLATMIPSLISLVIGGASLISGIPGLAKWLHDFMPECKAVRAFDRTWLAVVLTLQTFLGAILGVAAGVFLVVLLSVYVMPDAGLSLLEQARAVADYDLPARAGQFFASFL